MNYYIKKTGSYFIVCLIFLFSCKPSSNSSFQEADSLVYDAGSYKIYSHSVIDSIYGGEASPAFIADPYSICSPVRITPKGKTRVVDTGLCWEPVDSFSRFPSLHTAHASVDAIFNLALDVLYRCSSGEFMRNEGEEGMWQAGFRTGEGYGVWTRDVAYISFLMGSFIDEQAAKKSIEYTTLQGIDNGEDGMALPSIAVWNYYVVTGDTSIIQNTYTNLKQKVGKIQYDEENQLGFAHCGSFIDSRYQPEAAGFPLSTNILYMEAYRVMALMGEIMNEDTENITLWQERAKNMKQSILDKYWNPDCGYFTFGPVGSDSYKECHWENLGISLALWPQWNVANDTQRKTVFDNKESVHNKYGFCDLNYRKVRGEDKLYDKKAWPDTVYMQKPSPDNILHGLQVWPFTNVGIIAAMAKEKRKDEVLQMLSSLIRSAAIHKTFYECTDWNTGKAWRYPGQLWHAMSYISTVFYGVLGMEYDQNGLHFSNACVPKPLANMQIDNFKYRNAVFKIKVIGWGTYERMEIDHKQSSLVGTSLTGEHLIEIYLKEK